MEARTNRPTKLESQTGIDFYDSGKTEVSVSWKKFEPSNNQKNDPQKAVLFIPGYSITENARSIKPICQTFADKSGLATYAVDTRAEEVVPDSLFKEAEAVRQFIQERGLTEVTLVGNSQGGAEVIHLAATLQEQNPGILIRGLVLFDSVLYGQRGSGILGHYTRDILNTTIGIRRPLGKRQTHIIAQNAKYAMDGVSGILTEVLRSKAGWFKRTLSEIRDLTGKNPDIAKIKSPVVIIQGAEDIIYHPDKIAPVNSNQRGKFLQDHLFTASPYVRMVVPEKMGFHNVSYSRPESVAGASLYLLERYYRTQSETTGEETVKT